MIRNIDCSTDSDWVKWGGVIVTGTFVLGAFISSIGVAVENNPTILAGFIITVAPLPLLGCCLTCSYLFRSLFSD